MAGPETTRRTDSFAGRCARRSFSTVPRPGIQWQHFGLEITMQPTTGKLLAIPEVPSQVHNPPVPYEFPYAGR